MAQSGRLIRGFSYVSIGNMLFLGIFALVAGIVVFHRDVAKSAGGYIPLVAVGMLALLVLRTGIGPHHFLLALPLVLLTRNTVSGFLYYPIIAILTVTTLVSQWGTNGFNIHNFSYLPLHPDNSAVTRFFMDLHSADWWITLASLANVLVLIWLLIVVIRHSSQFWRYLQIFKPGRWLTRWKPSAGGSRSRPPGDP